MKSPGPMNPGAPPMISASGFRKYVLGNPVTPTERANCRSVMVLPFQWISAEDSPFTFASTKFSRRYPATSEFPYVWRSMTLHQPHHVVYTSTIMCLFSFFAFSVAASNAIHGSFFSPGAGLPERLSGADGPADCAGGETSVKAKRTRIPTAGKALM